MCRGGRKPRPGQRRRAPYHLTWLRAIHPRPRVRVTNIAASMVALTSSDPACKWLFRPIRCTTKSSAARRCHTGMGSMDPNARPATAIRGSQDPAVPRSGRSGRRDRCRAITTCNWPAPRSRACPLGMSSSSRPPLLPRHWRYVALLDSRLRGDGARGHCIEPHPTGSRSRVGYARRGHLDSHTRVDADGPRAVTLGGH
jgi:hypothetical protein